MLIRLQVVLDADLADQVDLGFQPLDMLLGILQDIEQQVARDVIAHLLGLRNAFLDGDVGAFLQFQVGRQHFFRVFADQQLVQGLQVGQAVQHQDAVDQAVGMLHFADRFVVFLLAQLVQSPVAVHARMQEVLVDRRQFVGQLCIQQTDNVFVALHGVSFLAGWE
jgi:hypothetical protein